MAEEKTIRPGIQTSADMKAIEEKAAACYQCGTCSGSCPVAPAGGMDYTPRTIKRFIKQ